MNFSELKLNITPYKIKYSLLETYLRNGNIQAVCEIFEQNPDFFEQELRNNIVVIYPLLHDICIKSCALNGSTYNRRYEQFIHSLHCFSYSGLFHHTSISFYIPEVLELFKLTQNCKFYTDQQSIIATLVFYFLYRNKEVSPHLLEQFRVFTKEFIPAVDNEHEVLRKYSSTIHQLFSTFHLQDSGQIYCIYNYFKNKTIKCNFLASSFMGDLDSMKHKSIRSLLNQFILSENQETKLFQR